MKKPTSDKPKKEKVFYEELISALRSLCRGLPEFKYAKEAAKREFFVQAKNGNQMRRVHYECAYCKRCFLDGGKKVKVEIEPGIFIEKKLRSEIAIDHIHPIIDPDHGFEDYNTLIARMFKMGVQGLQVLCNYPGERDGRKSCHSIKTQDERKRLRATKARLAAQGSTVKTAKER